MVAKLTQDVQLVGLRLQLFFQVAVEHESTSSLVGCASLSARRGVT
jgi:hypothetical protein